MLRKGADHFITIVVIFSITQNVGALAGSALMGTYEIERVDAHTTDLSAQLVADDPQVAGRISAGALFPSRRLCKILDYARRKGAALPGRSMWSASRRACLQ